MRLASPLHTWRFWLSLSLLAAGVVVGFFWFRYQKMLTKPKVEQIISTELPRGSTRKAVEGWLLLQGIPYSYHETPKEHPLSLLVVSASTVGLMGSPSGHGGFLAASALFPGRPNLFDPPGEVYWNQAYPESIGLNRNNLSGMVQASIRDPNRLLSLGRFTLFFFFDRDGRLIGHRVVEWFEWI
jgi:hypothetical protein